MPGSDGEKPKLWSYTGSTARRRKRSYWPEEARVPERPARPQRARTRPLRQASIYPREWFAFIAAGLVGGAFLLILAQFNLALALGLLVVLVLAGAWEVRRITRRGPSGRSDRR
jgi:hypothetical protein